MSAGDWLGDAISVLEFIKSDLFRYTGDVSVKLFMSQYIKNHSFKYSFWFRMTKSRFPLLRLVAIIRHKRLSVKYSLYLPRKLQVGYGLYIGHPVGIIVHPTAVIGCNVNLSQFVTIGSNRGKAAIIGDDVYIGPSVCIIEDVFIGSGSTVGAGSVVTKNVDSNATVAGVPAKLLSYENPSRFICNKWTMYLD